MVTRKCTRTVVRLLMVGRPLAHMKSTQSLLCALALKSDVGDVPLLQNVKRNIATANIYFEIV